MTEPNYLIQFKGSVIARWILARLGWRIVWRGLPTQKGIIIAFPHTSNWDFVIGILVKWGIGLPLRFWAKEGLFTGLAKYTLGPWMRYLGAIPVERASANGMIKDTLVEIEKNDYFWLALSPEGTRSYTPYLRSGFYRVAVAANLPLGLAYFDYAKKECGVDTFMTLTGVEVTDLASIQAYYAQYGSGFNKTQTGVLQFKPKAS